MALSMSAPSTKLATILVLALASCGPAAVRPPPSAVEITLAPGEAPAAPPPVAEPAPPQGAVEVLAPPSPLACEISGQRVFSAFEEPLTLCLTATGPCFARVVPRRDASKLSLRFAEGAATQTGMQVELDDGKFVVRGVSSPHAVQLYPRLLFTLGSPTSTGDFLVPFGRVLEVESAARGKVTVVLRLDAAVALPGGVARAERRCDELSVDASRFGAEEVRRFIAGKPAPKTKAMDELPLHRSTPLSTTPGLPPVAALRPHDDEQADVDVLERRGRDARVLWLRAGYAVYGWVPAAAIRRSGAGAVFGVLGGVPGGTPAPAGGQAFACGADLALFVEVGGRRVEVGRIRKGARFAAEVRSDGFVAVDLLGGPVDKDWGAVWLVRNAELVGACAPV